MRAMNKREFGKKVRVNPSGDTGAAEYSYVEKTSPSMAETT
jgi:hypothetical protein